MQTRRDQLQAYRYLVRRVLAAMLGNDPEAIEQPMRRVTTSTFAGIMVGALACAGVALYAWLGDSSSTRWKNDASSSVIVEKETGALYLYLPRSAVESGGSTAQQPGQAPQTPQPPGRPGQSGQGGDDANMILVPVRNTTSALLIRGSGMKKVSVSRESLAGIPRGPEIGIAQAPTSVPLATSIRSAPWAMCATAVAGEGGAAAGTPRVTVLIGTPEKSVGGRQVGDAALLVRGSNGSYHLVWHGRRLAVGERPLASLGYSTSAAVPVDSAWLRALPAGQELAGPVVPGRGEPSPVPIGGESATIGQLFHTPDPDRYYVMTADGFARLSEVQAKILLGTGAAVAAGGEAQSTFTEVAFSVVLAHTSPTDDDLQVKDLPPAPPRLATPSSPDAPLCLWYDNDQSGDHPLMRLTTGGSLPQGAGSAGSGSAPSTPRVLVPPGGGALAALLPGPGVRPSGYYLVTESGVKFPVPDTDTLARLGYAGAHPLPVPPTLLNLVPTGPALSQQAAYRSERFAPESGG
ncbi:type VII secretion protein EccB [Actinopolymorpha singaporensis]|uniref:Type VII secretion protein EccB n=1 Tax=Actinopolymorpha singaporensis TaxID=117157 RepID=A0A1H1NI00_9ACTN|nr:type VII secretion protein EccB [Actinopolymorpha singaporensis]SDR97959.1 type VII secretion protein EccB [Actinopolymorpha singaporensis]